MAPCRPPHEVIVDRAGLSTIFCRAASHHHPVPERDLGCRYGLPASVNFDLGKDASPELVAYVAHRELAASEVEDLGWAPDFCPTEKRRQEPWRLRGEKSDPPRETAS
jgi:hypothetical protein